MNIFVIIGLFGTLLIVLFYFLSQYFHRFLNSKIFYLSNMLGSSLIIISLLFNSFNLPSFCIESLWIMVSAYGYYKNFILKNSVLNITNYLPNKKFTYAILKKKTLNNEKGMFHYIVDINLTDKKIKFYLFLNKLGLIKKELIVHITSDKYISKLKKLLNKNILKAVIISCEINKDNFKNIDIIIYNTLILNEDNLKNRKYIKLNFGNVNFQQEKVPVEVLLF